jgi:2-oxoglutarate ferredoxin oxidoreductase subunit beta
MTRALRGYIRPEIEHTPFCPGCGHGSLMGTILRAIEDLGWDMDEMLFVSGIGCSGRLAGYMRPDSYHTTHGRALPFATGLRMALEKIKPGRRRGRALPPWAYAREGSVGCPFAR